MLLTFLFISLQMEWEKQFRRYSWLLQNLFLLFYQIKKISAKSCFKALGNDVNTSPHLLTAVKYFFNRKFPNIYFPFFTQNGSNGLKGFNCLTVLWTVNCWTGCNTNIYQYISTCLYQMKVLVKWKNIINVNMEMVNFGLSKNKNTGFSVKYREKYFHLATEG